MNVTIIARTPTSFTLQVEVPYNDSMLDFEETLQDRLNHKESTAFGGETPTGSTVPGVCLRRCRFG